MTTPDLSEFRAQSKPRPCTVGRWMVSLPEQDVINLEAAFNTLDISASAIFRWCEKRDAKFQLNALMIHRRKACSCHRT